IPYRRLSYAIVLPPDWRTCMKLRDRQPDASESRPAVALTVAWMLSCMSTAVGMLTVLALHLLMLAFPVARGGQHTLAQDSRFLLLSALISGTGFVSFSPLFYRVLKTPPPSSITVAAVMIGVAPIVLLVVLNLLQ